MVTTIRFSRKEVEGLVNLAHKRHNAKDSSFRHKYCMVRGAETTAVPHEIGILGEAAYGKCIGEDIDREIYEVRDDGSDFKDTEVKTVTYFGHGEPELKVPEKDWLGKHKDIKKFILTRINPKDYSKVELLGQITREQFDKLKKRKVYGPNKPLNYVVRASQLSPILGCCVEAILTEEDDFGF